MLKFHDGVPPLSIALRGGGVPPLSLALCGGSLLYETHQTVGYQLGALPMSGSEQTKWGLGSTAPAWF